MLYLQSVLASLEILTRNVCVRKENFLMTCAALAKRDLKVSATNEITEWHRLFAVSWSVIDIMCFSCIWILSMYPVVLIFPHPAKGLILKQPVHLCCYLSSTFIPLFEANFWHTHAHPQRSFFFSLSLFWSPPHRLKEGFGDSRNHSALSRNNPAS